MAADPRFTLNQTRVDNQPALIEMLGQAMGHMTSDEVCNLLAQAGVVAGAIRDMSQVHAGHSGVSADLFVQVSADGRAPSASMRTNYLRHFKRSYRAPTADLQDWHPAMASPRFSR